MEDIEPDPQQQPVPQEQGRRELTALQTRQIVCELLRSLEDPNDLKKLRRGAITDIARRFHVHHRTIRRVWARAVENYENPHVRTLRASPRKNKAGRRRQWIPEEVREAVKEVPIHRRRNLRCPANSRSRILYRLLQYSRLGVYIFRKSKCRHCTVRYQYVPSSSRGMNRV